MFDVLFYVFLTVSSLLFLYLIFVFVPKKWNDPITKQYSEDRLVLIFLLLICVMGLCTTVSGFFI